MTIQAKDINEMLEEHIRLCAIAEDLLTCISDHMKKQPYSCNCAECGQELEADTVVHDDLDLGIDVFPCDCQKQKG
jgi:hypothetical protein